MRSDILLISSQAEYLGPSSTIGTNSSPVEELTATWFLHLVFHFGTSPFLALPTPISLHFLGGFTPISTKLDQIVSPRLSHLLILSSCSSSEGFHLLFKILRIASGDTLNC